MGAWSTDLLGNDSALDLLDNIVDGEFDLSEVEKGMRQDYIDHETGVAILVLIELGLAARGLRSMPEVGTKESNYEESVSVDSDFVASLVTDDVAEWLVEQSERVCAPRSEEFELWAEAGGESFASWLANVDKAVSDLRHALQAPDEPLF